MTKMVGLFVLVVIVGALALVACVPPGGGPAEKTVYVGPYQVECVGVAPQQCLLVREDPNAEWSRFYDQIEGFVYEEGYNYELLVMEETIDNPPADASSIKWTLVELVDKSRSLEGTPWVLQSYRDTSGAQVDLLAGSQITAQFRDGQVGGNAGCNSYFGGYEVSDGSLTVGAVGMTEMYCFPEELMAQEGQYLEALQSAASYRITEERLEIDDAEGETVLSYSVLEPLPLVGTPWALTSYNNGKGGVVSVLAGTEITALFGDDGRVSGSAGCNNYNASYQVEGGRITVGLAAATMMMCPGPEGIMEQEGAYLAALEKVASYHIQGDVLELVDAGGTALLTYALRQSAPLVGTGWQVTFYNNGKGGLVSALAGSQITAVFGEDGSVAGTAGCNNYKAAYQVEGETIQIGPAATTRMMCAEPAGIMEQETAYLAALESAATYLIEGDRLALLDASGTRAVEMVVQASTGLADDAVKTMD